MELPGYVRACMERLEAAGYRVYAVGGCVRDALLGKQPQDYDLCTSAKPEALMALFSPRAYPTGLRHGTVTLAAEGGKALEVTTFRTDGPYLDGRHPSRVAFVDSLREDLARRDFTINAMAYHPAEGYIDPFSGMEDLRERRIRAVGRAEARFREDGLRILRALRFGAALGFGMEEGTARALEDSAPLLKGVARERVGMEFMKLLPGPGAEAMLLGYPAIYALALPGGGPPGGLGRAPAEGRLAYLLLRHPAPFEACASLRLSAAEARRSADLCRLAAMPLGEEALLEALEKHPPAQLRLALELRAIRYGPSGDIAQAQAFLNRVEAEGRCLRLKELQLDGDSLLALGLRGRAVGACLRQLLRACGRGELENRREPLLRAAELFVKGDFNEEYNPNTPAPQGPKKGHAP